MTETLTKTAWLDGVRGTAALLVVFGHCSSSGIHVVPYLDLRSTAKAGVWAFFMLSAYLLGAKLIEQFDRRENVLRVLSAYAVRRVLRIMPLYLIVLAVVAFLGILDPIAALRNAALLEGWAHFWTIPTEMRFYVALPALTAILALTPSGWRRIVVSGFFIASVLIFVWLIPPPRIGGNELALLNYLPFFSLGLVVLVFSERCTLASKSAIFLFALCTAAAIALHPRALAYWSGRPLGATLDLYPISGMAMAGAFFAAATSPAVRRIFELRALRFVGTISFGVYLTHFLILFPVAAWPWPPEMLKGPLVLALTSLLATICYLVVERPVLRFGARIAWSTAGPSPMAPRDAPDATRAVFQ